MDVQHIGIECDVCHRPVTEIEPDPFDDTRVTVAHKQPRNPPGADPIEWMRHLADNRGDRGRWVMSQATRGAQRRPDGSHQHSENRWLVVCKGKKHKRYEFPITETRLRIVYERAIASGRSSVTMTELRK